MFFYDWQNSSWNKNIGEAYPAHTYKKNIEFEEEIIPEKGFLGGVFPILNINNDAVYIVYDFKKIT